ncbi:MAG: glycosyltransferase family 4 protein [Candidatus Omnitrophota bacterium]
MKTLLITFDFPPIVGGISTVFYNVWKYLPGDDFCVLAPRVKGSAGWDKSFAGKVLRRRLPVKDTLLSKFLKLILLFFFCLAAVSRERIQYLLCGQPIIPGIIGLVMKKFRNIPFQVWVYGGEVVKFKHEKMIFRILLAVLKEADSVVVNSEFTRGVYVKLGVPEKKIITITPAVDTDFFRPGMDTAALKAKYGISDKRVLMTVARLSERKGHDMVIRVLARLKAKYPDLMYLIVGTGPDEKRLRALVLELGVADRVIFCGGAADEELALYYNLCDIHIMPNRQVKGVDTLEGFGLSFIEASACAKPVIGGRSGGSPEAVRDQVTGFIVDPFNVEVLADKVDLLLRDKGAASKMGEAGRRRAVADFQWKDRAKIIEDFFKR